MPRPSEPAESLPRLPPRDATSHKGTFGRVLLVGGSRGMTGAMVLAGRSALRGGAGLVQLAVPEPCLEVVAAGEPAYMTTPLPSDSSGRIDVRGRETLVQCADAATVLGLGPGMGRSAALDELVGWLYSHLDKPIVVDADALNALVGRTELLRRPGGVRILTPHPGEFARLLETDTATVSSDRERLADELAKRTQALIVVKGHQTYLTDGTRSATNQTGNPGMATGGSGDVLTGLISALLAQGMTPFDAARLGVHVHGTAGDLAAQQLGQVSLTASDLVNFLPQAFVSLNT